MTFLLIFYAYQWRLRRQGKMMEQAVKQSSKMIFFKMIFFIVLITTKFSTKLNSWGAFR